MNATEIEQVIGSYTTLLDASIDYARVHPEAFKADGPFFAPRVFFDNIHGLYVSNDRTRLTLFGSVWTTVFGGSNEPFTFTVPISEF